MNPYNIESAVADTPRENIHIIYPHGHKRRVPVEAVCRLAEIPAALIEQCQESVCPLQQQQEGSADERHVEEEDKENLLPLRDIPVKENNSRDTSKHSAYNQLQQEQQQQDQQQQQQQQDAVAAASGCGFLCFDLRCCQAQQTAAAAAAEAEAEAAAAEAAAAEAQAAAAEAAAAAAAAAAAREAPSGSDNEAAATDGVDKIPICCTWPCDSVEAAAAADAAAADAAAAEAAAAAAAAAPPPPPAAAAAPTPPPPAAAAPVSAAAPAAPAAPAAAATTTTTAAAAAKEEAIKGKRVVYIDPFPEPFIKSYFGDDGEIEMPDNCIDIPFSTVPGALYAAGSALSVVAAGGLALVGAAALTAGLTIGISCLEVYKRIANNYDI